MNLKQVKAKVFNLTNTSSTKELKKIFSNPDSYDFRKKSSWENLLDELEDTTQNSFVKETCRLADLINSGRCTADAKTVVSQFRISRKKAADYIETLKYGHNLDESNFDVIYYRNFINMCNQHIDRLFHGLTM